MRKSGYYWIKVMSTTGGEEMIAHYNSESKSWFAGASIYTEDDLLVLSSKELLPPGKEWRLPSDPPPELKAVVVWAQGNKSVGYAIAYAEKSHEDKLVWWEAQSTMSSSPLNVLFWQELSKPVSE